MIKTEKEALLQRLRIEIEEKVLKENSYIYVVRDKNGAIKDWYYTDSVEELQNFQKELFESEEFATLSNETKSNFSEYIREVQINKPFLENKRVSDLLDEIKNSKQ